MFETRDNLLKNKLDNLQIAYGVFELIEEQQDIDIQAIENISITPYKGFVETCRYIETKGNEIINAVKQLDRKMKEGK